MTQEFYKLLHPGLADIGRSSLAAVFVEVEYSADGKLSLTAVEGPLASGDCLGSCGQADSLAVVKFAPGWDASLVDRLRATWRRWHLNDMRPGSPAQMDWLRASAQEKQWEADKADTSLWTRENGGCGWPDYYTWAKRALARAGLQPDNSHIVGGVPYSYGSAWLREEVPSEVVDWLRSLPDSERPLPRA